MITASEFILHCHDVRQNGPGDYTCKCPAHADSNASLHVKQMDDGGIMLKCFAGCQWKDIVAAAGWQTSDMFPPKEDKEEFRRFGITLAEYSRLKKLSVESLAMYGLKDHKRQTKSGKPYDSVDFPYWSPDGQTVMGLRFRKAAHKNGKQDFRFEWEEGSHLCLYVETIRFSTGSISYMFIASLTRAGRPCSRVSLATTGGSRRSCSIRCASGLSIVKTRRMSPPCGAGIQ